MLQKTRFTAITVSELLREKQQGGKEGWGGEGVKLPAPPLRLGLRRNRKSFSIFSKGFQLVNIVSDLRVHF